MGLKVMLAQLRQLSAEAKRNAVVCEFAGRHFDARKTNDENACAILAALRASSRPRPEPMTEVIVHPSMLVQGAAYDVDDLAVAFGACCSACGMRVRFEAPCFPPTLAVSVAAAGSDSWTTFYMDERAVP